MELPEGLQEVPLASADAEAVTALIRECEEHDGGRAQRTVADMDAIWQRPSFVLARSAVGVRDGQRLVAYASLLWGRHAEAHVHPSHRGRGVGSALAGWIEALAAASGLPSVGQSVHERNASAIALLQGRGYATTRTSWGLVIDLDEPPPAPAPPAGYALRAFVPGADDRAAYQVIEDAFAEWPDRDPEPFADWEAEVLRRPGFDPAEQIQLVVQGDDIAGAAVLVDEEGVLLVDQLAVARAHRGRGLARALLQHAFVLAHARGRARCELWTDTRTGALGLYEHVGMRVVSTWPHLERPLGR